MFRGASCIGVIPLVRVVTALCNRWVKILLGTVANENR
jgi:hypothetical protein